MRGVRRGTLPAGRRASTAAVRAVHVWEQAGQRDLACDGEGWMDAPRTFGQIGRSQQGVGSFGASARGRGQGKRRARAGMGVGVGVGVVRVKAGDFVLLWGGGEAKEMHFWEGW